MDESRAPAQKKLSAAAWRWGLRLAGSIGIVSFAGSWIRFSSLLYSTIAAILVIAVVALAASVIATSAPAEGPGDARPRINTVWVWFERVAAVLGVLSAVAGSIAYESILLLVLLPLTLVGLVYLTACAYTAVYEGRLDPLPSWTNAGRAYGALLVPVILILMFGEPESTLTDIAGGAAAVGVPACGAFATWIVARPALIAIDTWYQETARDASPAGQSQTPAP